MNILFDGNYLFHKSYSVFSNYHRGESMEKVLKDKKNQHVLLRKCVMDMCYAINRFKDIDKVLFVIDSSSWRYYLYKDYKYSLTKVRDPSYKYFLVVLGMFEELLRKKGIIVTRVMGAEGDDLLYTWGVYFDSLDEDLVIITGDSDIKQIITPRVSLFNNNSKNLRLFCNEEKEEFWNGYIDTDIVVTPVRPIEVILDKVIMGDTSDNIPKLKRGFGKKTFEKFLESISPYKEPKEPSLIEMARWIATRFCNFANMKEEDVLDKIIFNLKMAWLNLSVYNEIDYPTKNGDTLLNNMIADVVSQKDKYSYKGKYSLEFFYKLPIK